MLELSREASLVQPTYWWYYTDIWYYYNCCNVVYNPFIHLRLLIQIITAFSSICRYFQEDWKNLLHLSFFPVKGCILKLPSKMASYAKTWTVWGNRSNSRFCENVLGWKIFVTPMSLCHFIFTWKLNIQNHKRLQRQYFEMKSKFCSIIVGSHS